jgi:uncharacterized protein YjdB
MKPTIFKIGLFVAMLLYALHASAYDFEANGLYFDLTSLSDRTCKLTSGISAYSGSLVIPESVNYEGLEFQVTEIDAKAFNSNITELSIPQSVSIIPYGTITKCKLTKLVFCDGEKNLKIADYVKEGSTTYGSTYGQPLQTLYIGRTLTNYSSFTHSTYLTNLEIGPYVKEMPDFYGSSKLENVLIPDNVTKLKGLDNCSNLKMVYIGNGVEEIANYFLQGCKNLETVYLGSNITKIGYGCFNNCSKLTNLYIFSDLISIIGSNTTESIEYTLPKTVSKIYVSNPSRYDNLLNGYYLNNLITINNSSIEYNGKVPQFSYKNNVYGSSIIFDSENINVNCGEYNSTADVIFNFNNGWSSTAIVPISYTITPAQLTIIPENVSRQFGNPNPELYCSFFGFKNNETVDVLTRLPNVETTATVNSSVGTYPIIATGAEAQNYSFNYERGTLTVTKANQEIEWNQSFDTVNVGDIIELTAISTSDLPVKYTVTDESIAEIYSQGGKKYIEFLKPGSVSIRATQEGNENYNEADRISKSVTVVSLVKEVILNQTNVNINEGDTYQLTTIISPSDAPNKTLEWSSSNTEVATVDANGLVTAHKVGTATITVATTDGSDLTATCALTVTPQVVIGLTISSETASIVVDKTLQLTATIAPENATTKALTWSSSDESVATVDETGLVTAHKVGTATITVATTDGSNLTANCALTVTPQVVTTLTISSESASIVVDKTLQLTATIVPENATTKALTWSSSDESVATVDETGLVTAHKVGTATITVATTDGSNLTAICALTVTPQVVTALTISSETASIVVDKTLQLTATIAPENATTKAVTWSSSDESVATVDETGLVTAHKVGNATITVATTDGSNLTATCALTVTPQVVTALIISSESASIVVDKTLQLTATIAPENATTKALTWSSSDESVATVDETGLVTAHKVGNATITVATTDGSHLTATCALTVTPQVVTGLTISSETASIVVDKTLQLTATIAPENATTKALTWSSSDESVATVDETGLVTAHKVGTATITVATTDGSNLTANCALTVTPQVVESIELSQTQLVLNIGDEYTLEAVILPDNATDKSVVWASSDSAIVIVTDGVITALAAGTATITVTAVDDSKVQATCEVEVKEQSAINSVFADKQTHYYIYTLSGILVKYNATAEEVSHLATGYYIINGKKIFIK